MIEIKQRKNPAGPPLLQLKDLPGGRLFVGRAQTGPFSRIVMIKISSSSWHVDAVVVTTAPDYSGNLVPGKRVSLAGEYNVVELKNAKIFADSLPWVAGP